MRYIAMLLLTLLLAMPIQAGDGDNSSKDSEAATEKTGKNTAHWAIQVRSASKDKFEIRFFSNAEQYRTQAPKGADTFICPTRKTLDLSSEDVTIWLKPRDHDFVPLEPINNQWHKSPPMECSDLELGFNIAYKYRGQFYWLWFEESCVRNQAVLEYLGDRVSCEDAAELKGPIYFGNYPPEGGKAGELAGVIKLRACSRE